MCEEGEWGSDHSCNRVNHTDSRKSAHNRVSFSIHDQGPTLRCFLEALRQDQRTVRVSLCFVYATSRSSDLDLKTSLVSLIQITMFPFVEVIEINDNFYGGINY